jgi:hypothetical protein
MGNFFWQDAVLESPRNSASLFDILSNQSNEKTFMELFSVW